MPEPRGKLCAAYDPSGAVIVCGGGERFWRPNANCWQLVAGLTTQWQPIPNMYPVHGAATTFYKGKFWVLGGSTGDDSHDHTITDKVGDVYLNRIALNIELSNLFKGSSVQSEVAALEW